MRRTTGLVFLVMAVALVVDGGATLAATIRCDGGVCEGTTDSDTLEGSAARDVMHGLGARDRLYGNAADELHGGDGQDLLWGGYGADEMYGGPHNDDVYGEGGNDYFYGGPADPTLAQDLSSREVAKGPEGSAVPSPTSGGSDEHERGRRRTGGHKRKK